ncbi:craniofacial development protein 2-like [Plakobranchus ocellatus]|uniref:Craniofacial development protein 2-like n=1 Tax=Plakobranchus ocellatus TaxID=259542 RepID=A0AAV3YYA9_9GAST|nr:craniofacial development protein 2-like [Plakobranchus ocellatus]
MEERRKAKEDEQQYRELEKQVKKRCNKAKEHWINTQCKEIEANTRINSKSTNRGKRGHREKSVSENGCLRSRGGDIIILNRWSEYITELYHDDRGPPPIISILEEEVRKALKMIKKRARLQDPMTFHPKC